MFKVVVDKSHAFVSLTADGFFEAADLRVAAAELHAAIRSLGVRAGRHVTLYDLAGLQVVSATVLTDFAAFFTDPTFRAIWATRVALVTRSALVTLQMERVRGRRPDMRLFTERRDAVAWLLAAENRDRLAS